MTRDGWKLLVLNAASEHAAGRQGPIENLAAVLEMQDDAKQALRDKGYGCLGLDLLKTVEEVPSR